MSFKVQLSYEGFQSSKLFSMNHEVSVFKERFFEPKLTISVCIEFFLVMRATENFSSLLTHRATHNHKRVACPKTAEHRIKRIVEENMTENTTLMLRTTSR